MFRHNRDSLGFRGVLFKYCRLRCRKTIALGYWKLARFPVSMGVWVSLSRTVYLGLRLGLGGVTVRPSMALTAAVSTNMCAISSRHPGMKYIL
jgi:hypothetical protein